MSEPVAICGKHPFRDMDSVYICTTCDKEKTEMAVTLATAIVLLENHAPDTLRLFLDSWPVVIRCAYQFLGDVKPILEDAETSLPQASSL